MKVILREGRVAGFGKGDVMRWMRIHYLSLLGPIGNSRVEVSYTSSSLIIFTIHLSDGYTMASLRIKQLYDSN